METAEFRAKIEALERQTEGLLDEILVEGDLTGWVLNFAWPAWKQTDEAISLRDDAAALAAATPEQLARLLTVLIRQDRFVEGALGSAYESGLLTSIVRRAAELVTAPDEGQFT